MKSTLLAAVAAVAAVALALAGCGGSDGGGGGGGSDSDQIKSVINDGYGAFAAGDAQAFCDTLSADFRPDFEDYYGPCEDATLDKVLGELSAAQKQMLEEPEIGPLNINTKEKTAYPDVNGDGLEIVYEGGKWKLDDFDVPGS